MDWGATNNWGHDNSWTCDDGPEDTILTRWDERSKMTNYTWATNKGVPYEMMCDLCNSLGKDLWVCVPHCASDEYIREMATLIKGRLNANLKIYVEYSNEIWNWMFGQTQWLNNFYCEGRKISWPEGIVDRVQNNLNIWTDVFADDLSRLTRVAGVQTAWQDVANRTIRNLDPDSFDAIALTAYFGLGEKGDSVLDGLGASATVSDVARFVREEMKENEVEWIKSDYDELGIPLNKQIVYYEAGQHITPTPFGEEPAYAQALLDIQRDTAIYNLYKEWFAKIEDIIPNGQQALYMNFSFIGTLSAQYGSWGILETLDQDTSRVPAPKYKALMEQISKCEGITSADPGKSVASPDYKIKIVRRSKGHYLILADFPLTAATLFDLNGKKVGFFDARISDFIDLNLEGFTSGNYILLVKTPNGEISKKMALD
ncbi:MAG TPA: T9SS type A sorting domain-containing protein, partial [Prolixibacteraceae bacterium]|nr:T9SS type A sorting domain-containing protein [Prolixibacteraceae bacterium]